MANDKVKCQYCDKEYSAKGVANHEKACDKNPENIEVKETPKTKNPKDDIRLGYGDVSGKSLRFQVAQAHKRKRELAEYYKKQEKVEVQISPMYRPYFGNSMAISLNGIPIYVPCDNKRYKIPKSYAMEVASRIRRVDTQIKRESRMSNVKENFDGQRLGSLDLIKRV